MYRHSRGEQSEVERPLSRRIGTFSALRNAATDPEKTLNLADPVHVKLVK
jgi:hypothetical protein